MRNDGEADSGGEMAGQERGCRIHPLVVSGRLRFVNDSGRRGGGHFQ